MENSLKKEIENDFYKNHSFKKFLKREFQNELSFVQKNKFMRFPSFALLLYPLVPFIFIYFIFWDFGIKENHFDSIEVFWGSIICLLLLLLIPTIFITAFSIYQDNELKRLYNISLDQRKNSLFPFYNGKEEISDSINKELERLLCNIHFISSEESIKLKNILNNLNDLVAEDIHIKSSKYQEKLMVFYKKLITNEYLLDYNNKEKEKLERFNISLKNKDNELFNKTKEFDSESSKYAFLSSLLSDQKSVLNNKSINSLHLEKLSLLENYLNEKIKSNFFLNEENFFNLCSTTESLLNHLKEEEEALENRVFEKISSKLIDI